MGKRIAILLLLAPGAASAQGTLAAQVASRPANVANRSDCTSINNVTSTWTWTSSTAPVVGTDNYLLAANSTTCSTTVPTLGSTSLVWNADILSTGQTQSFSQVLVATMATAGGVSDCAAANDTTIYICVYLVSSSATSITNPVAQTTFNFQLAIPPPPVINSVSPNDSSLTVSVSPGTTDTLHNATTGVTYTVTCTPASGTGSTGTGTGSAGNITCGGLTNNVSYTVTAIGSSAAGNPGPVSNTFPAGQDTTPLPFESFWQVYKDAGGVETGGCGSGGTAALAPVGAALALLALRRRRP